MIYLHTYIFLQLQLTILFAKKIRSDSPPKIPIYDALYLLDPPIHTLYKKRCLCAWIYEKQLIFALMIHRRRYDLKTLKKSAE